MGQSPVIVPLQDLNTSQVTREPVAGGVGISGSRVVFRGTDSEHGEEVWIVNSGAAVPADEVRPGPESSFPDGFAALGTDHFCCVADDGVTGPEVRIFTLAGRWLKSGWSNTDLRPGADHTAPVLLGSGNGVVWYAMDDLSQAGELAQTVWAFAGGAQPLRVGSYQRGTVQQASVVPGTSRLCFIARRHSESDLNLFTVDGMQQALRCGAMGSPAEAEPLPQPAYAATSTFVCFRQVYGSASLIAFHFASYQIWMLQALGPSVTPWLASNGTDRVCFAGYDSANGIELWATQGTPATTQRLSNLAAGSASSYPSRIQMVPGSNQGVFFQTGAEGGDRSLYFAAQLVNTTTFQEVTKNVNLASNLTVVSSQEIAFSRPNGLLQEVMLGNGLTGALQQLELEKNVLRLWHPSQPTTRGLNWLVDTGADYRVKVLGSGSVVASVAQFQRPASGGSVPQVFQGSPVNQIHVVGKTHTLRELRRFDGFSTSSSQVIPLLSSSVFWPQTASSDPADFYEIDGQLVLSGISGGRRVLFFSHTGEPNSFQVVETLTGPAATPGAYDVDQVVKLGARLFFTGTALGQTSGGRRLFSARYAPLESSYGGVIIEPVENVGLPVEADAVRVAAGKAFFVSPGSTKETLGWVDDLLHVTIVQVFDKDSLGVGITDLMSAPDRLFFSAMAASGPSTGQRTIWSSTGLANASVSPSVAVVSPKLMGLLGGEVVFWNLANGGNSIALFRWTGNIADMPFQLNQTSLQAQPTQSRWWRKPSGLEAGGRFNFANRLGQSISISSTGQSQMIDFDSFQILPEHLGTLNGSLLYHRLSRSSDYWGLRPWNGTYTYALLPEMPMAVPGPLIPHGARMWFSRVNPGNPPHSTGLWASDSVSFASQPVASLSNNRVMVMKEAGTFRGHLFFGGEPATSQGGIEPCILNTPPQPAAIPLITGAVKEQPFTFTYSQIVTGPATDAEGDPVSPPAIFPGASGVLKQNGTVITAETPILPGDTFEWTPAADPVGNLYAATVLLSDPWSKGQMPVLIRVETPLDEWTRMRFTPPELADPAISGIEADSDGDGVGNGLEFLFGRNPRAHETEAGTSFTGGLLPTGERHMVFSFKRVASLPAGTLLEIDQSADLVSWSTVAQKDGGSAWNPLYGTVSVDEVTLLDGRIQTSLTMDEFQTEPRFLRLRMTVP